MQKSWHRYAIESLVIVASVLLALAADAWWDGRQAAKLEESVLTAVAAEVATNQVVLRDNVAATRQMLERTDVFLRSSPESLASLPQDSVFPIVDALYRPVTFDPVSAAAPLLSQTAILSPTGVRVRALVSTWLTRVDDVAEEKNAFQDRSQALVTRLAPYAARAAKNGIGTSATMIASLGPTVLGELRADSDVVNGVVLRAAMQRVYLDNLETLTAVLDSLAYAVTSN